MSESVGTPDLPELVLLHTRELREALEQIVKRRRQIEVETEEARKRAERAAVEIGSRAKVESDVRREMRSHEEDAAKIRSALAALEVERNRVFTELTTAQGKIDKIQEALDAVRKETQKLRNVEMESRRFAESTSRAALMELNEAEKERMRDISRSHFSALTAYNSRLADRLSHAARERAEVDARADVVERFRQERERNPELKGMWEQREQLRTFVSQATIAAVRETLVAALASVERGIEEKHPGALALEGALSSEVPSVCETIYFGATPLPEGTDGVFIFLPITPTAWESLASGLASKEIEETAHFLWRFISDAKLGVDDGEFAVHAGSPVFMARSFGPEEAAVLTFRAGYRPGADVEFRLDRLPDDVERSVK